MGDEGSGTPPFDEKVRLRAIAIIEDASKLLKRGERQSALSKLQVAIETLAADDGDRPESAAPPLSQAEKALVRATGGAIMMIGILLSRHGICTLEEFAGKLGVYGAVCAETSKEEGLILAAWSGMLTEIAEDIAQDASH